MEKYVGREIVTTVVDMESVDAETIKYKRRNKMKLLKMTMAALWAITASAALFADTFHWKGGTDRKWKTAANWVENEVPSATDDVIINADAMDSGGDSTVVFDNYQTVSVRNLTILKTMNFDQGRINLGGDLVIADGCKLKMNGSWNTYSLYLTEGSHEIDCRGSGNRSDFVWTTKVGGLGTFVKRGTGVFRLPEQDSGTPGWGALDVGAVEVYEGELNIQNRHLPNVTNIVVDGATARLSMSATGGRIAGAQDAINNGAVVKILNGGRISDSGAGLAYTVKELWTDDGQCLAGTYTPSTLSSELGASISITVTDDPPPSTYHWKGGIDRKWTTAANWVEQKVPRRTDDVVINADATDSGGDSTAMFDDGQTVSVHDLTILKTMNFGSGRINLDGDLVIADGCKLTMSGSWNSYSLYLSVGAHTIDCQGTGKSSLVWSSVVGGPGTFVKRGTGIFSLPEQYSGTPGFGAFDVGGIEVYGGELNLNNHHLPNVTNIVVDSGLLSLTATGERVVGAQDAINHDAVVNVLNGGRISDGGAGLAYTVKEFYVDGIPLLPGTYTSADYPDNIRRNISFTVTDIPFLVRVGDAQPGGANCYKNIQEAFDAVRDGETVTLLESFPFTTTIAVTNKTGIVVDLNGKTATYSGNSYFAQIVGSSMTVMDSSSTKSGCLSKKGSGTMIEVGSSGASSTLTLDSGAVVFAGANTVGSDGACVKVKNGLFTMDGGSLDNGNDPAESSVRVCADGTAVFNGGTVTGAFRDNEGGVISIPVKPNGVLNEVRYSVNPGDRYLDDPAGHRFKRVDGWYVIVKRLGTLLIIR